MGNGLPVREGGNTPHVEKPQALRTLDASPRRILRNHSTRRIFKRIGYDVLNKIQFQPNPHIQDSAKVAPTTEIQFTPEEALKMATEERDRGNFRKVDQLLTREKVHPDYKWWLDSALLKEEALKKLEARAGGEPIEVEVYEDPMHDLRKARIEMAIAAEKNPDAIAMVQSGLEYAQVYRALQGEFPSDFVDNLDIAEKAFDAIKGGSPQFKKSPEFVTQFADSLAKAYEAVGNTEKAQHVRLFIPHSYN